MLSLSVMVNAYCLIVFTDLNTELWLCRCCSAGHALAVSEVVEIACNITLFGLSDDFFEVICVIGISEVGGHL